MKRYIRSNSDILDTIDETCYQTAADNEGSGLSFRELVDVAIENLSDAGYELNVDYSREDVKNALENYSW